MHVIRGASANPQWANCPIFTGEVHAHTFADDGIAEHWWCGDGPRHLT